jgi:hypothetical protein
MKTQSQFDNVCRTISEDQWQLNRKKAKRARMITAITIAIPMAAVVALSLAAAYLGVLH